MDLTKVRRKKVRASDIQENCLRIQSNMKAVNEDIDKTLTEMRKIDRNADDEEEKYAVLQQRLADSRELYSGLQEELEKEYTILKKYKDSKFFIAPKDAITIAGVTGLAIFMIALERENPKATKLASFILKLFPMKL